jgi:hypothetical protein
MGLLRGFTINLQDTKHQHFVILLLLLTGSCLRLLWATDMEWKSEEQWMFEQAQLVARGEIPLPVAGMPSGVRVPNPGMTVWWFALIATVARDPIAMVRWVQFVNILTLWLFYLFIFWQIAPQERQPWLWGLAIASVNPLAVVFSRKIWIPDLLPPFCFLVFLGHWFRKTRWGSFVWGIAGALIGQVHMGGFLFTLGLLLWTIWHDYKQQTLRKTVWIAWLLGAGLGSLPLIPWALAVLPQMEHYTRSWLGLLVPKFYVHWIATAVGVNLSDPLQKVFWRNFLCEPMIFGVPTYLMAPAHLFLLAIGWYPVYRFLKSRRTPRPNASANAAHSKLKFYIGALAWGVGGVFTLSGIAFQPYYIMVVFPFAYIWLALMYQNQVRLMVTIALMQLFITSTFLIFIHRTGGVDAPGYGIVYRLQMQQSQTHSLPAASRSICRTFF